MRDIGSPLGSTMLDVVNECRVDNADTFWTGAFCPDAISRPVQIPCFDIAASPGNRITNPALKYVTPAGFRCLRRYGDQTGFSQACPGDAGGVAPCRGGDGKGRQDAG